MRFDPRAVTGIPTEPVGSLPRPQALLDAYADFDAGRIDDATLDAAQDTAVRETIRQFEATGSPIVSDGEQRRGSFATYPVTETPAADAGRSPVPDADGRYLAVFADGHGRLLSPPAGGPFRYKTYAADTLSRSTGYATRPLKQAVVSPSMLALLYPEHEVPGYPREQFESDLVDECERDIRSAFTAGAARVSVDFADGRLASRNDPRTPRTGTDVVTHFAELINGVLDRFNSRERGNIGIHTCIGADRGPAHTADVPYAELLPDVLQIDAGYFLFRLAAESDPDTVCAAIGKHLRADAGGVTPMAYVGVIDPASPHVESTREVADLLVRAATHIPAEQLGSTDDCGFSPFSADPTPLRGLPDLARGIAFRKIRSRVEGTYMAAEKIGIA